jgi:hypothetical protein
LEYQFAGLPFCEAQRNSYCTSKAGNLQKHRTINQRTTPKTNAWVLAKVQQWRWKGNTHSLSER